MYLFNYLYTYFVMVYKYMTIDTNYYAICDHLLKYWMYNVCQMQPPPLPPPKQNLYYVSCVAKECR